MIALLLAAAVVAQPAPVDQRLATIERVTGEKLPGQPWYVNWAPPPLPPLPWYLNNPMLGQEGCFDSGVSITCNVRIHTPQGTISGHSRIVKPRG